MTTRVNVCVGVFVLALSTTVSGQVYSSADTLRPAIVSSQSRSRVVGGNLRQNKPSAYSRGVVSEPQSRSGYDSIRLEPPQIGASSIRGIASADITEIIIEIRDVDEVTNDSRSGAGRAYSRTMPKRQSPMAYRINHFSGSQMDPRDWQFTLRLTQPLRQTQEVRVMANGNEATPWLSVAGSSTSSTVVIEDSADRSRWRSDNGRGRSNQSSWNRANPQRPSRRRPETPDPCEAYPLRINVDWATGSVSPVQLKRSGDYCVTLSNANTVLYSYSVRVEAEEIQGNPFELLKDAIDALGKMSGGGSGEAATKVNNLIREEPSCELPGLIAIVQGKAADLEAAFKALLPGETGGKIDSIPLDTTLKAWGLVEERYKPLSAAAEELRAAKNSANPATCAEGIATANALLENFAKAQTQYLVLHDRVERRHAIQIPAGYLDAADNTKITVKEFYGVRETNAKELALKVPAGYHPISASAGFLVTQVPARTYSSRTAPDPANPTATQNVLGVDYGAGFRPALTALLHYNLPFKQQRQFGLALTAGPVYDISGGKADTSKFGFFGGVSARFSRWLYVTPGFHIGEFADFPEGFSRTGQVIPANTGTPVPNKRYTTRFALAVTYKIKDLGAATTPAQ